MLRQGLDLCRCCCVAPVWAIKTFFILISLVKLLHSYRKYSKKLFFRGGCKPATYFICTPLLHICTYPYPPDTLFLRLHLILWLCYDPYTTVLFIDLLCATDLCFPTCHNSERRFPLCCGKWGNTNQWHTTAGGQTRVGEQDQASENEGGGATMAAATPSSSLPPFLLSKCIYLINSNIK